jgi:hypothetical protein
MTPATEEDVKVEAVAPAEIEPADAGLPVVASREIAEMRERARMMVAAGVLATTALTVLAIVVNSLLGHDAPATALEPYFTALVGLSGAIIGWYFGGKGSTA